ncbi:hypothetical protein GCM10027318_03780 [Massilia agilis]
MTERLCWNTVTVSDSEVYETSLSDTWECYTIGIDTRVIIRHEMINCVLKAMENFSLQLSIVIVIVK